MSRAVIIPRERQQYLVDFFQKLDRMMTGLPVKVIVKKLPASKLHRNNAITDGKRVWLDWSLLATALTTSARLGINYQQVAHCFYGDPFYDREIEDNTSKAAHILLDCRDETLFGMMYPSVVPYLISAVQEQLILGRDLSDTADIWPLLYGRKFLPQPARFVCLPKDEDPHTIAEMIKLIDEFVALPPERDNVDRMLEITKKFAELMSSCNNPLVDPGGGKLIRGSRRIDSTLSDSVVKRITVTLDKDRKKLNSKLRAVNLTTPDSAHAAGKASGGGGQAYRDIEDDTKYDVTIVELEGVSSVGDATHTVHGGATPDVVEVNSHTSAREDRNEATNFVDSSGSSGSPGAGGSGGAPLVAAKLIEEGGEPNYTKYVWVDDKLEASWAKGADRLNSFKDILTTSDVRDLIQALEAEVLFDTDQLKKAGWEGCGAVNAELRAIRNRFEKDLKLASRTLQNKFAAGRRGKVSMKHAMKADRLPDVNIFSSSTAHLDQNDLDVELVMLCDASGSMSSSIAQAMKAQWVIGSAYEKRGAKVTIIPFNNLARDPLKGRDDTFSDRIFPFCKATGGTQPHGALTAAQEIFNKAGSRFKMLFLLTDGAWNSADLSHKIIDNMNYHGVFTTLVFLGGNERDYANIMQNRFHHCTEGFRVNSIGELLPQMRNTFFRTFNKAIIRTLRRYY